MAFEIVTCSSCNHQHVNYSCDGCGKPLPDFRTMTALSVQFAGRNSGVGLEVKLCSVCEAACPALKLVREKLERLDATDKQNAFRTALPARF